MSSFVNSSGILITEAAVPEEWPPAPDQAAEILLEVFSQHLVAGRDRVVRHAYETISERQPYARGRVHQRPFAALDELQVDDATRDKIVDVVAVFVDEAIEHVLSLVGAVTNTVGDFDSVRYELTAQIIHHETPAAIRYSTAALSAQLHEQTEQMLNGADMLVDTARAEDEASPAAESPHIPIGRGVPMWFDYRKWLGKYCSFRRSARPARLANRA